MGLTLTLTLTRTRTRTRTRTLSRWLTLDGAPAGTAAVWELPHHTEAQIARDTHVASPPLPLVRRDTPTHATDPDANPNANPDANPDAHPDAQGPNINPDVNPNAQGPTSSMASSAATSTAAVESIAVLKGHVMRIRPVSRDPQLACIANFVSKEEAGHLKSLAKSRLAPSLIARTPPTAAGGESDSEVLAWRTSSSCPIGGP